MAKPDNPHKPELMTSAELEKAIKEHQRYVRRLIEEVTLRRMEEAKEEKKPRSKPLIG